MVILVWNSYMGIDLQVSFQIIIFEDTEIIN